LTALGAHRLAVATSKPHAFAEPLLGAMGLRDHFELVVGPDLHARTEDKTATIARALAVLGDTRAVMVGDRSFDVVGAHANGIAAIGVTWGIGDAAELSAAERTIDAPSALPGAVGELL
jgi:phosphoglycolate phosphatase